MAKKYKITLQDIPSILEYRTDSSQLYFEITDWFLYSTKSSEMKSFDCFPTSEGSFLQLMGTLVHPRDKSKNISLFTVGHALDSFAYDSSGSTTTGIWIQTIRDYWIKLSTPHELYSGFVRCIF